ncbi:iron-dependent peroxidase [Solibacillus sp. FSL K6-1523]|uniref:iron-dependent peroxidase n=1 Tax=Solibacillus sp. FSL K6-1523 TaxID=2921471 RepID=UPI0030FB0A82
MNYIWDLLIRAENEGLSKKDIYFIYAKTYSPYMEVSHEFINANFVENLVEVNPYYRYHDIFKNLFHPDNSEELELRESLLDLLLHFLAEIDRMQGMNKKEFFIRFILRDIEANVFGEGIKDKMQLFSKQEKEIIALNMIRLYQAGDEFFLLKDTMKKLFKDCILYVKSEEKDELLVYLGQKKSEQAEQKVQLVLEMFLPIGFQKTIYWENHFGIIDVEETMKLDRVVIY